MDFLDFLEVIIIFLLMCLCSSFLYKHLTASNFSELTLFG